MTDLNQLAASAAEQCCLQPIIRRERMHEIILSALTQAVEPFQTEISNAHDYLDQRAVEPPEAPGNLCKRMVGHLCKLDDESNELREQLQQVEAERDALRRELTAQQELDWTGSLCDRLNELARENAELFQECRGGPSASNLIVQVHGWFNVFKFWARERDHLRSVAAEMAERLDYAKQIYSLWCNPGDTPFDAALARYRAVEGEKK